MSFVMIVSGFLLLTIFPNLSILDAFQGPSYASTLNLVFILMCDMIKTKYFLKNFTHNTISLTTTLIKQKERSVYERPSTKIENTSFPFKTAISEANVKTNRMVSTKWTYQKEQSFASKYFIFWCTNDQNVHIPAFCKR